LDGLTVNKCDGQVFVPVPPDPSRPTPTTASLLYEARACVRACTADLCRRFGIRRCPHDTCTTGAHARQRDVFVVVAPRHATPVDARVPMSQAPAGVVPQGQIPILTLAYGSPDIGLWAFTTHPNGKYEYRGTGGW
jgi:hypothetical protein